MSLITVSSTGHGFILPFKPFCSHIMVFVSLLTESSYQFSSDSFLYLSRLPLSCSRGWVFNLAWNILNCVHSTIVPIAHFWDSGFSSGSIGSIVLILHDLKTVSTCFMILQDVCQFSFSLTWCKSMWVSHLPVLYPGG